MRHLVSLIAVLSAFFVVGNAASYDGREPNKRNKKLRVRGMNGSSGSRRQLKSNKGAQKGGKNIFASETSLDLTNSDSLADIDAHGIRENIIQEAEADPPTFVPTNTPTYSPTISAPKKQADSRSKDKEANKITAGSADSADFEFHESFDEHSFFVSKDEPHPAGKSVMPTVAPIMIGGTQPPTHSQAPTAKNSDWAFPEGSPVPATPTPSTLNSYWNAPYWTMPPASPTAAPSLNSYLVLPSNLEKQLNYDERNNTLVPWQCPSNVVHFVSILEVELVGNGKSLNQEERLALEHTIESVYNMESLIQCDALVRTITKIELKQDDEGYYFIVEASCRDCPMHSALFAETSTPSAYFKALLDHWANPGTGNVFDKFFRKKKKKNNNAVDAATPGSDVVEQADLGSGRRQLQEGDSCYCPSDTPPVSSSPVVEDFMKLMNEAIIELRDAGTITNVWGVRQLEEKIR